MARGVGPIKKNRSHAETKPGKHGRNGRYEADNVRPPATLPLIGGGHLGLGNRGPRRVRAQGKRRH